MCAEEATACLPCPAHVLTACSLATQLESSRAEVIRLREWQDVVKRIAEDRVNEVQKAADEAAAQAAAQHAVMAGAQHRY